MSQARGLHVKDRVSGVLREASGVLARYVRAQVRISLILSAIYAVGLATLRVPLWPLLALVCGFAHAVPVFGALAAALITALVAWVTRDGYTAIWVMCLFAAASGLEGFYLTPRIMGRRLSLPPLWVFFGTLVAGSLFGFFGVLLAVPAMALIAALWRLRKK